MNLETKISSLSVDENLSTPVSSYSHYEETLDHNYSLVSEKSSVLVERKVRAFLNFLGQQNLIRKVRILDVGCGVGLAENVFKNSELVESVTGIDLCFESLRNASSHPQRPAHYLQADGFRLPFQDDSFDAIFTICTFHHVLVEQRRDFLLEMRRVLRLGGWLFAFEHNPFNPVTRFFVRLCPFDRGCRLLRPSELINTFKQSDFCKISRHFLIFFPSFMKAAVGFEKFLSWCPFGAQFFVCGQKIREEKGRLSGPHVKSISAPLLIGRAD
jgi:ubiquinone/menaquinone biosynthesis C-methylase UbiE